MSDYIKLANDLADREEARDKAIDAAGPYECSGIWWRTVDGEPTADGARWAHGWEELLSDASYEDWATQAAIFQGLAFLAAKPANGRLVPPGLAALVLPTCLGAVCEMAQEAAA